MYTGLLRKTKYILFKYNVTDVSGVNYTFIQDKYCI